jgi:hypothetical protein
VRAPQDNERGIEGALLDGMNETVTKLRWLTMCTVVACSAGCGPEVQAPEDEPVSTTESALAGTARNLKNVRTGRCLYRNSGFVWLGACSATDGRQKVVAQGGVAFLWDTYTYWTNAVAGDQLRFNGTSYCVTQSEGVDKATVVACTVNDFYFYDQSFNAMTFAGVGAVTTTTAGEFRLIRSPTPLCLADNGVAARAVFLPCGSAGTRWIATNG